MNTAPKSKLSILARFLGPVLSLDGELTKNDQNLIFARNGTGKSFLSRAFRYLDLHGQKRDISDAAFNLVSDESVDGKGSFSFSRGLNQMGTLNLEKSAGLAAASMVNTIFHVFSEDFVHEELRDRKYELDGQIENQITVDSENIKLDDAHNSLDKARGAAQEAYRAVSGKFEAEKISELHKKAEINRQLKEYKDLGFDSVLERYAEKPAKPEQSFANILKDLDSLKAIPGEPLYPDDAIAVPSDDIDLKALAASLERIISPSSVSVEIKKKIDAHHGFFEEGTRIVRQEHRTLCPFCEQEIVDPDPKAIIDAYIAYFEDEEEKHKAVLRVFFRELQQKQTQLDQTEKHLLRQKSLYDDLKRYIPSKREVVLDDGQSELKSIREAIAVLKSVIEEKAAILAVALSLPANVLPYGITALNGVIEANNRKADELTNAVERADEERKALQREACSNFGHEFAMLNWSGIENLRALQQIVLQRQAEVLALEKSRPSAKARDRVATTFELLLREFFNEKYVFDKVSFVLKRGDREMARGPHRTLSDGEKTAIAFCYFIACAHKKIETGSDYRKLYFIFDDPVTSMSYDFIFTIAQTLKNLNLSEHGEISINPGGIDGNKCWRPELLLLTHSSYFFNISLTNRVVEENAAFALHADGATHKLARLNKYISPFEEQLADVHNVANGKEPDFRTANSIRSVLEAVGRFCRPDKSDSLTNFVKHLAGDEGINIKSVLINSFSHGTYYDERPPPDDLILACKETVIVVERFAKGQLELIKSASNLKINS